MSRNRMGSWARGSVLGVGAMAALALGGTSAVTGCATDAGEAVQTSTAGLTVRIPASAQTRAKLGIHEWVVRPAQGESPQRVVGVDKSSKQRTEMSFRVDETAHDRAVQIAIDGQKRLVVTNGRMYVALTEKEKATLLMMRDDMRTAQFDASTECMAAMGVAAFAAVQVAIECPAAIADPEPATKLGLTSACVKAMAALTAASAGVKSKCIDPQTCSANYQCTDKYGAGWVCSAGACVDQPSCNGNCSQDGIYYPRADGTCRINGDCTFGQYCGLDGYCRYGATYPTSGGQTCNSDWQCSPTTECSNGSCRPLPVGGGGGSGTGHTVVTTWISYCWGDDEIGCS